MTTSKKPSRKTRIEFKGYLRVNLTDEQDKHYERWVKEQHIQLSDFDILLNTGFKFSLGWDAFHDGVSASLFANDAKLSWAGWILSAWSDNVEDAITLLFYKHYIICEEDWEKFYDVVEKVHRKRG